MYQNWQCCDPITMCVSTHNFTLNGDMWQYARNSGIYSGSGSVIVFAV